MKEAVRRLWGEEEVVPPGIILGNDRPEYFAVKRERLWSSGLIFVAGGAGRASVEISNDPVVNGLLIVVVTGCKAVNPPAGGYTLRLDAAGAGTPTANLSRDPRNSGIQSKNRIQNAIGASGIELDSGQAPAGGADLLVQTALPVILTQSHRLTLFGVAAAAISVVFSGYEFNARPEELAV